ncbi:Fic family protein [Bradyrhizobium sp.]|uniref:Fic family protein n=1 Tax=Bradyrhizobium sp. TaxID=376 RepID=UPI003C792539
MGRFASANFGDETVRAYVPPPLPPRPPVELGGLMPLIEQANRALGRLDGVTSILPSPPLFLFMYVRKEALLSSQIEGTQSSLSDLLLFENDEIPLVAADDVQEVSNYVAAMNYGLKRLREGFPLSLRLIREIHDVLLRKGRGSSKQPGEFRTSQNWIGGARPGNALFVPPPPNELAGCLDNFERFLHDDKTPTLIRAALAHVQFESIHPFLDGNGRLGRLLITFLLCADDALKDPMLYLSLYFKQRRKQYYDLLQAVRDRGDWEAWVEFFLAGVIETANEAVETARQLLTLFEEDRTRIRALGRPAASMLRVHDLLQRQPMIGIVPASKQLKVTHPTVMKALANLQELEIVHEITGRRRGRLFAYGSYMNILNRGTEALKD